MNTELICANALQPLATDTVPGPNAGVREQLIELYRVFHQLKVDVSPARRLLHLLKALKLVQSVVNAIVNLLQLNFCLLLLPLLLSLFRLQQYLAGRDGESDTQLHFVVQ